METIEFECIQNLTSKHCTMSTFDNVGKLNKLVKIGQKSRKIPLVFRGQFSTSFVRMRKITFQLSL